MREEIWSGGGGGREEKNEWHQSGGKFEDFRNNVKKLIWAGGGGGLHCR